jgi:thioredoxin 1
MDEKGVFLMSELNRITDDNFDETVEGSDVPVLVFFTAAWSRPDQKCLPLVQQLKDDYQGKVLFCAIDVDENPKTAAKFGIRGVPTVVIFKRGPGIEVVAEKVGATPKAQYAQLIDSIFPNPP